MLPVYDLSLTGWGILIVAAFLVGIAKTALPGLVTLSVSLFAGVLPARESTVTMLCLLLVGDLFAVWLYRHHVEWAMLRRLVWPVLWGLCLGVMTLWRVNDQQLRILLGVILLILTVLSLILLRWGNIASTDFSRSAPARWIYGFLGGFTTMVANAGGPPMTLYFMTSGVDPVRFLGTQAVFFFLVNLIKIPFQHVLGLHSTRSLSTALLLLPALLAGIVLGRLFITHISPKAFFAVVCGLTVVSSISLFF